jgi:hypothetical protein
MSAYYNVVINKTRYSPNKLGYGVGLMEHISMDSNYCFAVERELFLKAQPVVWLCDFHIGDSITELEWEDPQLEYFDKKNFHYKGRKEAFILNLDKREYFSIEELKTYSCKIHPLPLLTNSDKEPMGMGDYQKYCEFRSKWCGDTLSVILEKPDNGFKNITEQLLIQMGYLK